MKSRFVMALVGCLMGCGGGSTPPEPEPRDQCKQPFVNTVEVAGWAQALSPTQSYRYSHDLSTQMVDVELVGADSSLRMWQVYDHDSIPDGALRAELGALSLTTTGRMGPGLRHEVHAILSDGEQSAEIVARFTHERCFEPDEGANAPACAGNLPIGGGILLPSCGLIADNAVLSGVAPVLRELEYRVPVSASAPGMGGRRVDARGAWHTLLVKSPIETMSAADVVEWLSAVGADGLFLSDETALLTTAFLDRTWWREMDRQIAQCSFVAAGGTNLPQASGNGCNGDYCASDWNQGSGQDGGNNAWGDPHMTSLDGHHFDFQAAGEFVLLRSTAGDPIEVHMRTEPFSGGPPACGKASSATAIATTVGNTRIAFYEGGQVRVDGVQVDPASASIAVPEGASLTLDPYKSVIRWPDGSEMWVKSGGSLTIGFDLTPGRADKVQGILGNFDADTTNDFALPNGSVIPMPASFEDIHGRFADAWRVPQDQSLFDYGAGEDTSTFTIEGFPGSPLVIQDLPDADVQSARAECLEQGVEHEAAMHACIIDTVCAGEMNPSIAADARAQPLPSSAQKPGEKLATGGAVELVELPAILNDAPWSEPESTCEPRMRKNISLYSESRSTLLATDVEVAASAPGRYDSDSKLSPSGLAAGTLVDTWLLHRSPGPTGEAPLRGFVRFARPIVGVVVGGNTLNATDSALGASIPYQVGNARGLELGSGPLGDWFEISADRKQIRVQLAGDTPDQIRILTEVQ